MTLQIIDLNNNMRL